jgi:hypothetical protein
MKALLGTIAAEGAFKRADHRLAGVRRQIPVAAFTVGAHFQHVFPLKEYDSQ